MTGLVCDLILAVLIGRLDAPRFRAREAAHQSLAALGELAVPACTAGLTHGAPEVRRRCALLLAPLADRRAARAWDEAARLCPPGWRHLPWLILDGDYHGAATVAFVALAHARGGAEGGWRDLWADYRLAARHWLQGELLRGYTVAELRADLAVMAAAEVAWTWQALRLERLFP